MDMLKGNVFTLASFHQRYVIEVAGKAAGLVVQERGGFRFFASRTELTSLERELYVSPRSAEDACRALLTGHRGAGVYGGNPDHSSRRRRGLASRMVGG